MTPEPTDDGVLTPEELQPDDDYVDEIGANRYVVRADREPSTDAPAAAADAAGDAPARDTLATGASASAGTLADAPEPHGVEVSLKTDGRMDSFRTTSHDVREVFVDMLTWYASQLDDDLSPEDALRVMLATSDLEV